jgi:hypothetical protein
VSTITEPLHWHSAAAELPDADTDVLISFGDDQGTLVGAWMGDETGWVSTDGAPAEGVKHWAEMPKGPQC